MVIKIFKEGYLWRSVVIKSWINTVMFYIIVFSFSGYSLTSGPSQPEYSGFTPAKLESMVDLYTGDFTYSIPLMEIPGPSLSYPLTLGYRGGVQLEQEATWVGLGWCLNVGAINRSVNRYPDDYVKGKSTSVYKNETVIQGWDANIGLSVSGIGVGVNFGERSDQGWHFGLDISGSGSSVNLGSYNERDGWGTENFNSSNFGMTMNFLSSVGSLAMSMAAKSAQDAIGANLSNPINLGKGSLGFSAGGGSVGFSSASTSIGAFNSSSSGFSFGIKIGEYVNISMGYNTFKYWIYNKEEDNLFGYMYLGDPDFKPNGEDVSSLQNKIEYSFAPEITPSKLTGYHGILSMTKALKAFPISTPDGFVATAEGMSTNFRAYRQDVGDYFGLDRRQTGAADWLTWVDSKWWSFFFQGWLNEKRKGQMNSLNLECAKNYTRFIDQYSSYADQYDDNKKYPNQASGQPIVFFRQAGDAGGTVVPEGWRTPAENWNQPSTQEELAYRWRSLSNGNYPMPFIPRLNGNTVSYKKSTDDGIPVKDRISGSTGIFPVYADGNNPKYPLKSLTGFIVIRTDGMRYEYTLPVLNFYNKVRTLDAPDPDKQREFNMLEFGNSEASTTMERSYAYSFLLEAIKGPDYVDLNSDGKVDDDDVGGWVKFNYSTHIPSYQYRTPFEGVTPVGVSRNGDIQSNTQFKSYGQASWGTKEIYYLSEISTPTHSAAFLLSDRDDGREVKELTNLTGDLIYQNGVAELSNAGVVLEIGDRLTINYRHKIYDPSVQKPEDRCNKTSGILTVDCEIASINSTGQADYNGNSLTRVYTLQVNGPGFVGNSTECGSKLVVESITLNRSPENGIQKKLDRIDLYKRITSTQNENVPVKTVHFDYESNSNFQLCPGIPNTIQPNGGKLTLRKVRMMYNGSTELPPYQFTYYKEGDEARYHPDHWDRWGYYKHDGGLVPVKIESKNIALWSDLVAIIKDKSPNNVRGTILRDTLRSILNAADYAQLTGDDQITDIKSINRLQAAAALSFNKIIEDKEFYKKNKNNAQLFDLKNNRIDLYPNCKSILSSLRSGGPAAIFTNEDGDIRIRLADWEVNRVRLFNLALLSEMIYIKSFQASVSVEDEDRMIMKHLQINRFDHDPVKDDVDAWSLKQVTMPSGAKINITYESDDFSYVGRTRAVVPNTRISESNSLGDGSFYRYISLEKDLLTKNDLLRLGGKKSEGNLEVIEQNGTRAIDNTTLQVRSLFRVWRKVGNEWQLNPEFQKLKDDPSKKLHLIALFDPNALSTFMININCQECGVQSGMSSNNENGKVILPIPIDLGEIETNFELNDCQNGKYACQYGSVSFDVNKLELPENWEFKPIADKGECLVKYFRGIFTEDCSASDVLRFPGEKQKHYQFNFRWARKIDFQDDNDIAQNIPEKINGYKSNATLIELVKFNATTDFRKAAQQGILDNSYLQNGTHKGFFTWCYLNELGGTDYEPGPTSDEPNPPFLKEYWDYYSTMVFMKLEKPDVVGAAAGIIGGGVRVKKIDYLSGWQHQSSQPQSARTVEYQYVCEAGDGKSGNYSSGSTASMPPPYNNQGDDRPDVPPQVAMLQDGPKVSYGTVHEIRPGRGRIVYKFLTNADISDYWSDDSANYYRYKENGDFQLVRGAYNSDKTMSYSPFNPHHRWFLHKCSGFQGLMYRESKYSESGDLVNEKKIKYLTSLTKNDICQISQIGKMNFIDSKVDEVLVPFENAVAGVGTPDEKFKVHPLAKDFGVTRERYRMRWLFDAPESDQANVNCSNPGMGEYCPREYIGLIEVEAIEHAVHQYSIQSTVDGVGTKTLNSFFDFTTGEPIVTTYTEAEHSKNEGCGCDGGIVSPATKEIVTVPYKTTVTIPAYWMSEFNSGTGQKMAPIFKDNNFKNAQLGIKDIRDKEALSSNNMLSQPYSVSVYSGLEPYPACCITNQNRWIDKLSDKLTSGDPDKSALFKRNITTWKQFEGIWRKDKEIALRADMNADKRIDEVPSVIGYPYENSKFFNSGVYVTNLQNTKYDKWGRAVEVMDAYKNSVSYHYNIENNIGSKSNNPGLYMIGQVINSTLNNCAVATIDNFFQNDTKIVMPSGWSTSGSVSMNSQVCRSGKYSLRMNTGSHISVRLPEATAGKMFKISFWVRAEDGNVQATINGITKPFTYDKKSAVWQKAEYISQLSNYSEIEIICGSGNAYVDDIRIAPVEAKVHTVTYDRCGNLSSYCGSEDKIMSYFYDDQGRLIEIRDHQGMAISSQAQLIAE